MDNQPPNPASPPPSINPAQPAQQAAWVPQTPGAGQPVPAQIPKKGMPLFFKILIGCGALFILLPILAIVAIVLINPADKLEKARQQLEKTATASVTKNETADWKTYRSQVGKFEVKYPGNLPLDDTLDSGSSLIASLGIGEGVPDLTFSVQVKTGSDLRLTPSEQSIKSKVDGRDALLYKSSDLANTSSYILETSGYIYIIELASTNEADQKTLELMFSTFRFD